MQDDCSNHYERVTSSQPKRKKGREKRKFCFLAFCSSFSFPRLHSTIDYQFSLLEGVFSLLSWKYVCSRRLKLSITKLLSQIKSSFLLLFFSLSLFFSSPFRLFCLQLLAFFPFLSSPLVVLANNFDKEIAAYLRAIQLQPVLSERNWRNKQTHRPTNKTDIAISLSTK